MKSFFVHFLFGFAAVAIRMDVMQTKLSIPVRRFSEGRFTGGNSMREDPKARSCIIHGTASVGYLLRQNAKSHV